MLGEVLKQWDEALQIVSQGLASLGLEATTRLKTSSTTIDKLRRQPSIDLLHIHDLAGARFVMTMTLGEQDHIVSSICNLWENAQVVDRRETPSFGYRAVHVIVKVGSCFVEIQVRTQYQDTWAQWMERFADRMGREVRYGEEPDDFDVPFSPDSDATPREVIEIWHLVGSQIKVIEEAEEALVWLRLHLPPETGPSLDEFEIRQDRKVQQLKESFDRFRENLER